MATARSDEEIALEESINSLNDQIAASKEQLRTVRDRASVAKRVYDVAQRNLTAELDAHDKRTYGLYEAQQAAMQKLEKLKEARDPAYKAMRQLERSRESRQWVDCVQPCFCSDCYKGN
jgi:predicted  nucleic acid-binding Zn-ribbon protein